MGVFADISNIFEVLFFVAIIIVTLVVRGIKAAADRAQRESQAHEGHDEISGGTKTTARSWHQWRPEGQDVEVQWGEFNKPEPVVSAGYHQAGRGEINYQKRSEEWIRSRQKTADQTPPEPTVEVDKEESPPAQLKDATEVMEQAMATAFPKARRMIKNNRQGADRKIHLRIKGGNQLKRAILYKEALGQPRAFDL